MTKIIECSRDAWQGLPKSMPAEIKADYLRTLIAAGFRHIDAVAFLSRTAVPQMADSELVLEYLDPAPNDPETAAGLEMIGFVSTERGAERAIKSGRVHTLAFPYSISSRFVEETQSQTLEESLEALEAVGTVAYKAGIDLVAYVAMAFGNRYGEPWDLDEVVAACDLLVDSGVTQISLIDTAGLATPKLVADVVTDVLAVHDRVEIGLHLHTSPEMTAAMIRAAYEAGCRRFDSTLGGLGACPYVGDSLAGNIPTELLIQTLGDLGAELPATPGLDALTAASLEIQKKYGARVQ